MRHPLGTHGRHPKAGAAVSDLRDDMTDTGPLPAEPWSVIAVYRLAGGYPFQNGPCPLILGVDGIWHGAGFIIRPDQIQEWRPVPIPAQPGAVTDGPKTCICRTVKAADNDCEVHPRPGGYLDMKSRLKEPQ
mgnify:CR=1 FL=1